MSTIFTSIKLEDLAWAHRSIIIRIKNSSQCIYYSKAFRGDGINRLKHYWTRISKNVKACKKIYDDIKWQINEQINDLKNNKEKKEK